ncbi:MAG: hydroxymethylglutaryl-CoA lyase [Bdellovibrionaceae bacterium]|nr:hydroxymethylglutaryl-CoA lyase [Pseudobdellovibrionaceae bacterium]
MSAKHVELVEVGPRDGLQNETISLDSALKVELVLKLIAAGAKKIEIGSFVSPTWVPQMADTSRVIKMVQDQLTGTGRSRKRVEFAALVPNRQGMNQALDLGLKEVAIFASATESFSKKNINCSIKESFDRFIPVMVLAKKNHVKVRAHLSVSFGCPYEGSVSEAKVVRLAKKLVGLGCYQISIADTIGVAHAGQVDSLFRKLKVAIPVAKLAGHFHNTRGQALANVFAAYKLGVKVFDSSLGGLGGCPYAPGASGNVATEDLVYMFDGLKVKTGYSIKELIEVSKWFENRTGRILPSMVSRAGLLMPKGMVE